jgi:hypothetical protein
MIEFATLFLGLVFGAQPVEFLVHESVAAIEISLDHQVVGRLNQPPWQLTVDFGEELAPHVLEVKAYGSSGTELDRAEQWTNVFTQQTEVSLLVSPRQDGNGLKAEVAWESVAEQSEPASFRIELDGEPLQVEDPRQFDLPSTGPGQAHLLRVELQFSETLRAAAEAIFGGPYSDEVDTELTAVPVLLDRPKKLAPLGDMQDWFLDRDRALMVMAVEESQVDIVVVRDVASVEAMRRLYPRARNNQSFRRLPEPILNPPLKKDHSIRFITPVAREIERDGYRYQLFPPIGPFTRENGALVWLFSSVVPTDTEPYGLRLADAVAVAGMVAAQSGRRRVVVVIAGAEPDDRSQLSAETVLPFLRRLHVPVVLWTPIRGVKQIASWGPAVDISSRQKLTTAYHDLSKQLNRQRIVWLEGRHLPQAIRLSPRAEGVRLVE